MRELLLLAAGGTPTPADTAPADDVWSPQFLAACVAAVAAIVAACISWYSGRRQRRQTDQHREIDFTRSQLNDLYGPLVMWRETSNRIREQLPDRDDEGNEWRLVDHIEEVRDGNHPDWEAAAKQILQINLKVEELLTSKAGLLEELPSPKSYIDFLSHSQRLRMYWKQGTNQPSDQRLPFPMDRLDQDIAAERSAIQDRLDRLGVKRKAARGRSGSLVDQADRMLATTRASADG